MSLILKPEFVLPRPDPESLTAGVAVLVSEGRIAEIGDADALAARHPAAEARQLDGCVLMSGFVNAHQHGRGLSQIQLGYPDDFLEIWIANRRGRGILDAHAITRLAAMRMAANGVTATIHGNYSYGTGEYQRELEDQIRAYGEVGIRVAMCVGAMDQGMIVYPPHEACFCQGLPPDLHEWLTRKGRPAYAGDADGTVALMDRMLASYGTNDLVSLFYGPAGPQWVSDEMWRRLAADAKDKGLGLHFHGLESPAQRDAVGELYPVGAFRHLERLGAMTDRSVVAHGVWVTDDDIDVLASTGATVVRNPGCNLRMRNGIAPLERYLARGVRVAIGTDNVSSGDDEDLLAELRLADQLARAPDWSGPLRPTTAQLLEMLTVNGARAAGFGDRTGTVEVGMAADLVAVSLERVRDPYLDPDTPILDAMLARAGGADVRMTMVAGRVIYDDGRFPGLDVDGVVEAAVAAARSARLPADRSLIGKTRDVRGHLRDHYRSVARGKAER